MKKKFIALSCLLALVIGSTALVSISEVRAEDEISESAKKEAEQIRETAKTRLEEQRERTKTMLEIYAKYNGLSGDEREKIKTQLEAQVEDLKQEREQIYKASGHIFKTTNMIRSN